MSGTITTSFVGLALMKAGLSPFALDTDKFQVVWDGENYTVYTGRLPELYIEKTVPLYLFEYKNVDWFINLAMDRVNSRLSPVAVYRGLSDDTVSFRICLRLETVDNFFEGVSPYFEEIERALDAFGLSCEIVVRNFEEEATADFFDTFTNPDPDSPLLKNKTTS
jgi:hypothetical protein